MPLEWELRCFSFWCMCVCGGGGGGGGFFAPVVLLPHVCSSLILHYPCPKIPDFSVLSGLVLHCLCFWPCTEVSCVNLAQALIDDSICILMFVCQICLKRNLARYAS